MKNIIITSLVLISMNVNGQPGSQTAFHDFVISFNREQFDVIYNAFSDHFKSQVDEAVVTGGLRHVFETNGMIHSAIIEQQTYEEGSYVAIGTDGVFRVLLSIDETQRIDGLRIKAVPVAPSQSPSLVFNVVHDDGG